MLFSHFNRCCVNEMQTTFNNVQVKYFNKKPAKTEPFLFDKKNAFNLSTIRKIKCQHL